MSMTRREYRAHRRALRRSAARADGCALVLVALPVAAALVALLAHGGVL